VAATAKSGIADNWGIAGGLFRHGRRIRSARFHLAVAAGFLLAVITLPRLVSSARTSIVLRAASVV